MSTNNNNRKLTLEKNDECYTPDKVWDDINIYLPNKNCVIFEPFYGKGHSYKYFNKLKFSILGQQGLDF